MTESDAAQGAGERGSRSVLAPRQTEGGTSRIAGRFEDARAWFTQARTEERFPATPQGLTPYLLAILAEWERVTRRGAPRIQGLPQ